MSASPGAVQVDGAVVAVNALPQAAPWWTAQGLPGATAATRYVGGTVSGPPASGTFAAGDFIVDQSSQVWVCQAAGTPGTWATNIPATATLAADQGLLAWAYDLDAASSGFTLIAGTIYLVKIPIRTAITATYLSFSTTAAGAGASSGSYVGLYSSAGVLLSGSSDLGANIYSGNWQVALTTPQALTAGSFVWGAILTNQATTQPAVRSIDSYSGAVVQNLGLTAATYRIAVPAGGTSRTTLLGSFTPASNTNTGAAQLWFGIS